MKSFIFEIPADKKLAATLYVTALDQQGKPIEFMTGRVYLSGEKHYAVISVYDGSQSWCGCGCGNLLGSSIQNALYGMGIEFRSSDFGKFTHSSILSTLSLVCEQMGVTVQVSNFILA